jgi:lipoprotein signal peptidase
VRKAIILVAVLLAIAVVHAAFAAPAQRLNPGEVTRIVNAGFVQVDFVHVENRGVAFGLFQGVLWQRLLPALVGGLFAVGVSALFLSLVDQHYTLQLIALSCIVDSAFVHMGERLLSGYQLDYLEIGSGPYRFPVFNAADVAGTAGWLLLYGAIILRYFRWLPEPRGAQNGEGGLQDPFYERRNTLRVGLGFFIGWGAAVVLIEYTYLLFAGYFTLSGHKAVLNQPETGSPMASVFPTVLNTLMLLAGIAVWRAVPKRPIDALFLRSFGADERGWSAVKVLRKLLQPRIRLSGVVDPKESRRLVYLLYWVLMPFVLGIGDMGRVNAFRHNVFLTERWKEDLESAFPKVRVAIFDCRTITPNVAWELDFALKTLARRNVFFLVGNDVVALQRELKLYGPTALEATQCFSVADLRKLAEAVLMRSAA